MIEVLVRQHNMGYRVPRDPADVGVDRGRFDERRAGVDQQCSGSSPHQPDGDVTERQPAAVHATGEPFPGEMHTKNLALSDPRRAAAQV